MRDGRWPRRGDEVVVGGRYSREKGVHIGDSLRLNDRDFTIVGIGRLRGVAGFSSNSLVYMDDAAFRERAGIGDVIGVISIDTDQPAEVRQRLDEMGDLRTYTPPELVELAEQANATSVVSYQLLGGLTLGIGALFVSNMLSQSVVERRPEFATLKAIGLPNRSVLLIVGLEAVLICLAASVVGILLSLLMGYLMNIYYDATFGLEALYAPDAGIFANVFVLAVGLGVIAGLLPARRATRVDPVEILREA
jgi:putative ABC transport system permease protein